MNLPNTLIKFDGKKEETLNLRDAAQKITEIKNMFSYLGTLCSCEDCRMTRAHDYTNSMEALA